MRLNFSYVAGNPPRRTWSFIEMDMRIPIVPPHRMPTFIMQAQFWKH